MPWNTVMHRWKHGGLHSGSKKGPEVTNRKQAIAIMLSEKKKADSGDEEYAPKRISPSVPAYNKMMDKVRNKGKSLSSTSSHKKRA